MSVRSGVAHNRTCGDRLAFHLGTDDGGTLVAVRFEGDGCALCLAAAAALAESLEGQALGAAPAVLAALYAALATADSAASPPPAAGPPEGLGAFVAVAPFPARHRCVTLCAEAAKAALDSPI